MTEAKRSASEIAKIIRINSFICKVELGRIMFLITCSDSKIWPMLFCLAMELVIFLRAKRYQDTFRAVNKKKSIFAQITNNTTRGSFAWTSVLHRCYISFRLAYKMGHLLQQPFDYFLVMDLECTCEENDRNYPNEIIEFPIILVNSQTLSKEAGKWF